MKPQYIEINQYGIKRYFSDKEMTKLHREDGPAVECNDNSKEWYRDGERHRADGPASEWPDGTKFWWVNGKLHREDGPAVEHANGSKKWYRNDNLHREDGPACEWADGEKEWWIDGVKLTKAKFKAKKAPHNGKKVIVDGVEYTLKA